MDTIGAVYSTLPLIKEQLKEQARAERLEELRVQRDAKWVSETRLELDRISQPGEEYHRGRDDLLKISDARVTSVLALANYNTNRCARYLAQELLEQRDMAAFDEKFRKHFDKTCSDLPIPYPARNQLNSLVHSDFRTEAQALHVWDQVVAVIRRIYAVHKVIMPFNQTYRLLRAATFNVETAVNYHLKDVKAYRELKPRLISECHADRPGDYDPECAHTMLRRTNHSVDEAIQLYQGEWRRRWRAVEEFKEELQMANVGHVASDRAIFLHLQVCFWDAGLAKDRYDYESLMRKEAEDAADKAAKQDAMRKAAAGKEKDKEKSGDADVKAKKTKGGKKGGKGGKKASADADAEADTDAEAEAEADEPLVPVEVLSGPDASADDKDGLKTSTSTSASTSASAIADEEDDDIGIEHDIDFGAEGDAQSSSDRMMANEAARRARIVAQLEDGDRRDEPVLPHGAPFEPQTEINKLTSVMNVDATVLEVDAVWIPLPSDRAFTPFAEKILAAAGPRLMQELRSVKTWRTNQPVVTRGYNLPCKHVVWTPIATGEQALVTSVDAVLGVMKEKEWRSLVITDPADARPDAPVHRMRHVVVSRTRVFLDIVSNRRKTDAIVFADANKDVHQCWLRTMLYYYPGPLMAGSIGQRFADYKESVRGVLKEPAFLQELKDMRLDDEEQGSSVCYVAETPRARRACCGKF
jgi:hypothetical protein